MAVFMPSMDSSVASITTENKHASIEHGHPLINSVFLSKLQHEGNTGEMYEVYSIKNLARQAVV